MRRPNYHRDQAKRLRAALHIESAKPIGRRDVLRVFELKTQIAERMRLARELDSGAIR